MTEFHFATSDRSDGPMNLVGHPEFDQERWANRAEWLGDNFVGIGNFKTAVPKLTHGSRIEVVDKSNLIMGSEPMATYALECDGLITTQKGLMLTVTAGDCYPVFLYDRTKEIICLLHAGWRGLADKIVEKAILKLHREFNCQLRDIHIEVGPGICRHCYEVGADVWKAFGYGHIKSKCNFNLLAEIDGQAAILPMMNHHFATHGDHPCTFHNEEYFSFRRDGKINGVLNTQLAVAVMQ